MRTDLRYWSGLLGLLRARRETIVGVTVLQEPTDDPLLGLVQARVLGQITHLALRGRTLAEGASGAKIAAHLRPNVSAEHPHGLGALCLGVVVRATEGGVRTIGTTEGVVEGDHVALVVRHQTCTENSGQVRLAVVVSRVDLFRVLAGGAGTHWCTELGDGRRGTSPACAGVAVASPASRRADTPANTPSALGSLRDLGSLILCLIVSVADGGRSKPERLSP